MQVTRFRTRAFNRNTKWASRLATPVRAGTGPAPVGGGGVAPRAGVGMRGRGVGGGRACRAGRRAGGFPLAADLGRPPARPVLADAEGAADVAAARSPSWPAATSRR